MVYQLQRIDLWQTIKVTFLISLCLSIICGISSMSVLQIVGHTIIALTGISLEEIAPAFSITGLMIFFAGLMCAFFFIFISLVSVIFCVLLYNLIAHLFGGLKVDLSPSEQSERSTQPSPPSPPVEINSK